MNSLKMIRPRFQKIISDLWGNHARTLLVVASIAVGLFALGVMLALYIVIPADMQRGYASVNPAHITMRSTPFDQDLVSGIQRMPAVRRAEGVRKFGTRLEISPGEWIAMDITAMRNPAGKQINRVVLQDGVWPPAYKEIVIDRYKQEETKAQVGDYVTIEMPSGGTRQLKVVGVVQDQTIGATSNGGGFFNAPVQGFINIETLKWLDQPLSERFDTLLVTLDNDGADQEQSRQIASAIRDRLEKSNVQVINTALRSTYEHPNLYLVRAILALLVVIGLLVVFLSGFLITNTLQALLIQQIQQIGILKSIGAQRVQIISIYMMLNLLFGLLASAIALPLTFEVAFRIVDLLTVQLNNTFYGFRVLPQVVLVEIVVAVILPQIAALAPLWQGTRVSVHEALSGIRQDQPLNRGWLNKQISRLRNFSLLLVISLRNSFRRRGRLVLTLITLTLGGAVFISTFNVRVSLMKYVEQIAQYFLADVNITLDRSYRTDEIEAVMMEVPGVKFVEGWAFARTELLLEDGSVGENVSLLAPPGNSPLVEPILSDGRWIEPGDQNAIALSELFREQYPEMQVGDTIRLKVNGDDTDWVVVGFFQLAGKVSGFNAYTSYEYLTRLTNQSGKAASYRVVSSKPRLTRSQQDALGQALEAHLALRGIKVTDVTTGKSLSETAADGFNVLTGFLLFMALLTALVGSIGLTGTMSLNVIERTREIGVLRAIGASNRALIHMVLVEGSAIGLVSWLLASLVAFPISKLMADAISLSIFGAPTDFGFSPLGFSIWLGAVVLLSVLASVMPARNATSLTIREVLAYE